jgi:hypothetical protein
MIAAVTMGLGPNDNVSEQDQQTLASYYYHALERDLSKNFTLVNQPGPGAMTVAVALTDATTATPVLRTISVVIPQARLLNAVGNLQHDQLGLNVLPLRKGSALLTSDSFYARDFAH